MERREIGRSGLNVSLIGLGCSNFGGRVDAATGRAIIHRALDLDITFFDTADVYGNRGGSESCLGEALAGQRNHVVIATKFGRPMDNGGRACDASRAHIVRAVEASLRRLKTDWIDLYQLHWPDPETPIGETLQALEDLMQAGKIRAAGCSNFSAGEIHAASAAAKQVGIPGFISAQAEYSLLARTPEQDLLPALDVGGLSLLPYLPLAGGLLSGKYRGDTPPPADARFSGRSTDKVVRDLSVRLVTAENLARVERLNAFADARGRSLVELAFGWLAAQPRVASILVGASRPDQVAANVAATGWALSSLELAAMDALTTAASPPTP